MVNANARSTSTRAIVDGADSSRRHRQRPHRHCHAILLASLIGVIVSLCSYIAHPSLASHRDHRIVGMINYTHLAMASASASTSLTLNMPRIGLGTLGISPSIARRAIDDALAAGYRLFDCAPVYFNEREIGDAIFDAVVRRKDGEAATTTTTTTTTTAIVAPDGRLDDDAPVVLSRGDLFVTSKLANPFHRPEHVGIALRKTLNDLRLGHLDLFLVHWPVAFKYVDIDPSARGWSNEDIDDSDSGRNIDPNVSLRDTWTAMEGLVDDGLVRHIGVANFPVALLHDLLGYARIAPAVNQVELHPYNQQRRLVEYCHSRGVAVQAYSPLGTPGYRGADEPDVLSDPILAEIAEARGISVAQLCIRWSVQRGCHVVVKSSDRRRMEENLSSMTTTNRHEGNESSSSAAVAAASRSSSGEHGAVEVLLSDEEMSRIASLDRGYRFFRPEDWWTEMPAGRLVDGNAGSGFSLNGIGRRER
ncbi:hypothetical protein ACHAW5_011090 [Stephanodiscus triporus]|uniref:NADP-dependent oxidoreductase domain-containing protein n=1 Tax=Stephanodiscus triporus TaxID=2934178 RepID=A0ABD3QLZ2_9STRA